MTAEKQVKWTDQQRQAILARGGNVFVTASAGTGKTAVLSGRCVSIASDDTLCPDVLNMLVLTFTEAAAEQMHARIARQLREAYLQSRSPHLLRQRALLQGANISTIHSFCKRLITEHFYKLALDPSFRVIDGDEAMLLKAETLTETIEWAWQQDRLTRGLHELLDRRDLRDSDGFLGNIIRLSEFLEGVASPGQWCDRARRLAEQADTLASELGARQQQTIRDQLTTTLTQLHLARTLYEREAPDGDWGAKLQGTLVEPIRACLDRLEAGDWQGCAERIRGFRKPRFATPKGLTEAATKVVSDLRKTAIDAFVKLNDLATLNPKYLDIVGRSTTSQVPVLVELVERFNELYAQRKSSLKGLDFADLEHYALRLLTADDAATNRLVPSETALALRSRFKYIFVDEYQDINPVQQAILDALSSGDNVFVVGDVKQSIYAWRGADPAIFLDRLQQASPDTQDVARGLRVDLNYNFRSVTGILDFVNKVFGRIMTSDLGGIDYDEAAHLRSGLDTGRPTEDSVASDPHSQGPIVELHILDERANRQGTDGEKDGEQSTANGADDCQSEDVALVHGRQRQIALIARRIREIVGADTGRSEFQVLDADTGESRDVEYRDIVILMRSLAKKANDYVEILRLAGIPVSCDATAGYFEATEVCDVISLLKVLDNPQRDIEFATVLRSAFFQVSDTDLAKIRLYARKELKHADFYTCAVSYCGNGPDAALRRRLSTVFEQLEQWRRLARRGHLAGLLWRIYRESGFLAFVSALPNGQARKANLLRLHDRAIQFEGFASNTGFASLTRFVDFLERLQEAGEDWAPAQPGSAAVNAVRILSVHKSKGLEFPVVFLAELETGFNKRDLYADIVTNVEDTIGLQVIDPHSNTKLRSLAHEVIGEKKRALMLAEEMRVLYVATTRARDRLILTASQKGTDCSKVLASGMLLGDDTIPPWLLKACRNPLEWVLYGLSDQKNLHNAFRTSLAGDAQDQGLFEFHLHADDALADLSRSVLTLRSTRAKSAFLTREPSRAADGGRELLAPLKQRLNWQYPFSYAVGLSAKSSVTRLTHPDDVFVQRDYSEALDRRPAALVASGLDTPGSQLARLIGTASHLVLSSLDLERPVSLRVIEQTRDRLVKEDAIPEAVAQGIDTTALMAFFESELGRIVCDKRNRVWQEWPFTSAQPVRESSDSAGPRSEASDEIIVVQGVIDLLVQTPEGLLVIDFKTDRVSGDEVAERADVYRGQLDLYARAAAAIRRQSVRDKWLYFLAVRQAIQV